MKKSGLFIALACAISLGAGSVAAQQDLNGTGPVPIPSSLSDGEERYRIGFNDTLNIQVFRHPELTQNVTVNSNGTINVFRLPRPIQAVCKSERELAEAIAAEYRKDYLRNPEVNVIATEQRSQAFAVIGAVEKPGNYFINRRVRLLELIAYAGGPSEVAGTRVLVARTGSTTECKMPTAEGATVEDDNITLLDYKLADVLEAKEDLFMRPGDIVSIMDADIVYVYGNVNKQGQITMKTPMTLTQAIASAEGLKPATKKDKVRVLRQMAAGQDRQELVFDLRDIDRGRVQDPFLEPNDIVAVSEDRVRSILNGIKTSLTQGSSLLFYRIP